MSIKSKATFIAVVKKIKVIESSHQLFILNLFSPFPSHVPPFSFSLGLLLSADRLGDGSRALLAACGAGGDRFEAAYPELLRERLSLDVEPLDGAAPGGSPRPSTPIPVDMS